MHARVHVFMKGWTGAADLRILFGTDYAYMFSLCLLANHCANLVVVLNASPKEICTDPNIVDVQVSVTWCAS